MLILNQSFINLKFLDILSCHRDFLVLHRSARRVFNMFNDLVFWKTVLEYKKILKNIMYQLFTTIFPDIINILLNKVKNRYKD